MEGRELEAECTRQEGENVSATEASRSGATLQQQQPSESVEDGWSMQSQT